MWARLKLKNKILLLFLILSVLPLVLINGIWLRYSQDQLKQAAAEEQELLLNSIAQRINAVLDAQVNGVVSTSQDVDIAALNVEASRLRLLEFSNRENDAVRIALVDRDGNELVVVDDGALLQDLQNVTGTDAFRVVQLVSNKPLIGDVREVEGRPIVTISVPLLSQGNLGSQELTSTEALSRRFGGDIRGALIVDIDLTELWTLVLEAKLGDEGYMYLVDNAGQALVHPNQDVMSEQLNLSFVQEVQKVKEVLRAFNLEETVRSYEAVPVISESESGVSVLGSSFPISQTEWGLVALEPVSSVYGSVNRIALTAFIIFAVSIPLAIILVLIATKTVINPIRELADGVIRMSQGDFSRPIEARGNDELSVLARLFNNMADNLRALLERIRAKNVSLLAEQAKLQAVLDTIADGVIVLDHEQNIVLSNKTMASFVNAQDQSALRGKNWLNVFTLYYEDEPFNSDLLKGDTVYFHDVLMRVGDEQKFIDITAIRILNDPNGIVFILTVQDTTPRRELENMKLDFVSMAAHELRTPLTAISGYLKLINDDETSNEERESFTNLANSNANMLESLINNMLSLSRIERNALVVHKKPVNWSELVREEVESLKFMASTRNIEMEVELPEEPLKVWGDAIALREVLANLINNAVHYSEDNQKVLIKAEQVDDTIKTTVSDHGIGIPERLHSKLFTKYYRAKGGLATNSQGTGIGLFISKSIIDAHGGSINFDSTFGQGSDFYFSVEAYDRNKHRQSESGGDTIGESSNVDWFKK